MKSGDCLPIVANASKCDPPRRCVFVYCEDLKRANALVRILRTVLRALSSPIELLVKSDFPEPSTESIVVVTSEFRARNKTRMDGLEPTWLGRLFGQAHPVLVLELEDEVLDWDPQAVFAIFAREVSGRLVFSCFSLFFFSFFGQAKKIRHPISLCLEECFPRRLFAKAHRQDFSCWRTTWLRLKVLNERNMDERFTIMMLQRLRKICYPGEQCTGKEDSGWQLCGFQEDWYESVWTELVWKADPPVPSLAFDFVVFLYWLLTCREDFVRRIFASAKVPRFIIPQLSMVYIMVLRLVCLGFYPSHFIDYVDVFVFAYTVCSVLFNSCNQLEKWTISGTSDCVSDLANTLFDSRKKLSDGYDCVEWQEAATQLFDVHSEGNLNVPQEIDKIGRSDLSVGETESVSTQPLDVHSEGNLNVPQEIDKVGRSDLSVGETESVSGETGPCVSKCELETTDHVQ